MAYTVESRRRRGFADEWRRIVADWQRSGLSQVEFCRRRGFSLATFGGWKRRLGGGSAAAGSEVSGSRQPTRRFVEVVAPVAAAAVEFEIGLGNGRVVRVGAHFEEAALRRLLTIVEAGRAADEETAAC